MFGKVSEFSHAILNSFSGSPITQYWPAFSYEDIPVISGKTRTLTRTLREVSRTPNAGTPSEPNFVSRRCDSLLLLSGGAA